MIARAIFAVRPPEEQASITRIRAVGLLAFIFLDLVKLNFSMAREIYTEHLKREDSSAWIVTFKFQAFASVLFYVSWRLGNDLGIVKFRHPHHDWVRK